MRIGIDYDFNVFGFDDGIETFVYVCNLCGQPLKPGDECSSGFHVGPYRGKKGQAVRSTDLVRDIIEARKLHTEEQRRSSQRLEIAVGALEVLAKVVFSDTQRAIASGDLDALTAQLAASAEAQADALMASLP